MRFSKMMRLAAAAVMLLGGLSVAQAQTWSGFYVGAQVGSGFLPDGNDKFVGFDKNLDGDFSDTVTTAAGANAFSPGFCPGLASTTAPGGGCTRDDNAVDAGIRLGYDWQSGRFVVGATAEVSRLNATDSVTAFSTTPASYTFTRELKTLGGIGLRAGFGSSRFLLYASGGAAWGSVDRSFGTSNRVNTFVPSEEKGALGFQVGGGVEYRVAGALRLGAQYQLTRLNDKEQYTVRAQGPAPATNPFILTNPAGTDLRRADQFEFQSVRLTASYRF